MKISEFIRSSGNPLSKNSGEHLFFQDEQDRSLYFVISGLLKCYYLSVDGKENIKSFILPGDTIGSLTATYAAEACSFNLICLQPCELLQIDFDKLYQASKNDAELSSEIVEFLLRFAMKKERREYELLCLSAEDRYRRLVSDSPQLLDLVTQNEIALYLGVTPVGLSRIKKRVS